VRSARLHGIEIPPELVPLAIDEFPALFVAACCAEGRTVVRGAAELRVKESDRIAAMAEGLSALGFDTRPTDDGIVIDGRGGDDAVFRAGRGLAHHDHRIAMSLAIAALRSSGIVEVEDTRNVDTSFPGFVALARGAGLDIEEHGA
jgi:3-phosphoshikimate 1-carboxyvinyltransferase